MRRLLAVLAGAVLAAAFLGPGTVTTAARAGAAHGYGLLWALGFATLACLVLQEASARLTILSERTLGEALRGRFTGRTGDAVAVLVGGSVILGCAAYEAGNILGGVAGLELLCDLPRWLLTILSSGVAAFLLLAAGTRGVVAALTVLVAVMGIGFAVTATLLDPPPGELLRGLLVPTLPPGAGLLALGLVGTTVVPYNLFLGSGLARGQRLSEARFGLAVAIVAGGLISMAVLVVGAAVVGELDFPALAAVLAERLGPWARGLFAVGLFAAGFTSAMTAPWAAAMTARGFLAHGPSDPRWREDGWRFRAVWGAVLAVGTGFGIAEARPIPVIVLAQAANGLVLPIVAVFLWLTLNDRRLVGEAGLNGAFANLVTVAVVAITVVLGLRSLLAAAATALGRPAPGGAVSLLVAALVLAVVAPPLIRQLRAGRRAPPAP